MITARQRTDVVVVADGRSEIVRKTIRETFKSAVGDDFTELWLVFAVETQLSSDVRNPKRKVAWSAANMEVLFVLLPHAIKFLPQLHWDSVQEYGGDPAYDWRA